MPIAVTLDVMLAKRKMSLSELSEEVNISMPNLSILKSSRARSVRFSTLHAICKALECKPGDILEYLDDEQYAKLYARKNEKENGKIHFNSRGLTTNPPVQGHL